MKLLLITGFLILIFCNPVKAQWTSSSPNIYYDSGYVGVNAGIPETNLDVKGILQLRREGNADSLNPFKHSASLNFQTGFWESSTQTSSWKLLAKRFQGFSWGNATKNKSRLAFVNSDGGERFVLDDAGDFNFMNRDGTSVMNYSHWSERLNINAQIFAGEIIGSTLTTAKVMGYNWPGTSINYNWKSLVYTATGESGAPISAHRFTVYTAMTDSASNIATFDNAGSTLVRIDKSGNLFASSKLAIGNLDLGKVGNYALAVNGDARFNKAVVKTNTWPDYVFENDYQLPSLKEIEQFVRKNKHLPEIPSAAEVEKSGQDLGNNQALLLKKVEELTLYLIEQNKKIEKLEAKLAELEKKN